MLDPVQISEYEAKTAALIRMGGAAGAAAFGEIMDAHFDSAMQLAYRMLQSRDAAKDTAQWVFARIWEQRSSFRPTHSIKSYILGAVRNKAMNELRHDRIRQQHNNAVLSDPDIKENSLATEDIRGIENRATIDVLLARLSDRRREALELRYLEQLSYAEIGRVLKISSGAAEQLVIRSLEELRGSSK